ncbi:hypothetical protein Back11_17430 [Paenibacillus baekrokdamisoli]|uniref:Uncharacterized protein n=1 Tax=Paenibacillus baekrokdamisoli TaxID=1712516 RepID=A0A3G9J954_9BACL|nr:PadR family transcriptional regulator [Paenibacillus baekrokdamisoli]MBB3072096.1 DNA-binding PadR family transcriptional regulator [Paenibacillus baekrokdamisoli]BBH20398.1 hypothetical protein Back11_17430 [Paenibacillus baekrokdamisoli]
MRNDPFRSRLREGRAGSNEGNNKHSEHDHEHGIARGDRKGKRYFGRGDVKYALLELLTKEPMHGYQMMKALEEQSGGLYVPSAGSIYPTLQMLEDRSLILSQENSGKKIYAITDEGRELLRERPVREDGDGHGRKHAERHDHCSSRGNSWRERFRQRLGLHAQSYQVLQQLISAEEFAAGNNKLQQQLHELTLAMNNQLSAFLGQASAAVDSNNEE